jgi:nucleoside permease NupC
MGYYLQVLIGAILLVAIVIPLSNNIKEIKIKNILAAIAVMIGFGFLLLSEYVAGFLLL